MKQKVTNKDFITNESLLKTLEYYPTKKELEAAKEKLRSEIMQAQVESNNKLDQKFIDRYVRSQAASRAESDYKFSLMREDMHRDMSKFTNMVLNALDPLIQDMQIRQEEREITAHQYSEVKNDVENLKKRVAKLEHS